MPHPTTEGRPGLKISSKHPLIADLEALRAKHRLTGCVLVSFSGAAGTNSVTAAGKTEEFMGYMKTLGDRILARIDDGEFDPERADPDGSH